MATGIAVLIAALIVVLGTSVLKTADWSSKTKETVAGVLSVVAGIVTVLIDNGGDFAVFGTTGVLGVVVMIYGAATAIHKFLLPKAADDFLEQNVGNKVI